MLNLSKISVDNSTNQNSDRSSNTKGHLLDLVLEIPIKVLESTEKINRMIETIIICLTLKNHEYFTFD